MNADASLNALVDNIYGKRTMPGTDEENESVLIFDYDKEESISTRSSTDVLSTWRLYIYVGSKVPSEVFSISDRVQEYLEGYTDEHVKLIKYLDENEGFDDELDIHYNDIEYYVIYSK